RGWGGEGWPCLMAGAWCLGLGPPEVSVAVCGTPRALAGRRGWTLVGTERELHALGMRREHDRGLGPGDTLERAHRGDQLLERGGVRRLHLEQQRVLARHVMAFGHAVQRVELALERADQVGVAGDHADEGRDVEAQPAGVEGGVVARDHSRGLELLDALEHGGSAQPDVLADASERGPAVLLQHGEDATVCVVELRILMVAECHKAPRAIRWSFIWANRLLSMGSLGTQGV